MSWFILSVFGYLILAAVNILDKFILAKISKPAVFTFYTALFVLPLVLLLPFGVKMPAGAAQWLVIVIAGITFLLGLWTMYRGVEQSEISHVGPLIGALVPFFSVFIGRVFLREILSDRQLAAIALLIVGSLVISFEKSKKHNGFHVGMLWGVGAGLCFAVSNAASKYLYDTLGFYSGFVLSRVVIGALGMSLLALPLIRKEIFGRRSGPAVSAKPRHDKAIIFSNRILAVAGVLLVQYAIALGSVSVVNAMEGIKYAALIIAVALLSKFAPKFFKEDYGRLEMAQEAAAVMIIGVGLLLFT